MITIDTVNAPIAVHCPRCGKRVVVFDDDVFLMNGAYHLKLGVMVHCDDCGTEIDDEPLVRFREEVYHG